MKMRNNNWRRQRCGQKLLVICRNQGYQSWARRNHGGKAFVRNGWRDVMAPSRSVWRKSSSDMVVSGGSCFEFGGMVRPSVTTVSVNRSEDTVEVCPAWAEAIGGGDLSCPTLAAAMVRGGVGSRHLLLRSSYASRGGGGARVGVASLRFTPLSPPDETPGASDVDVAGPVYCWWMG